ncbi:uncharacterized protein TrAtP1_005961 [Trichoderma atroviride]|uniref:uncharacterized protein n=1 Tax=Hypocrea atroviridis TaxID=63577 RepID=UPI003316EB2D|nr:hypothetical protein TrAtP1_005961 [Trichoderma atroviride]
MQSTGKISAVQRAKEEGQPGGGSIPKRFWGRATPRDGTVASTRSVDTDNGQQNERTKCQVRVVDEMMMVPVLPIVA